MSDAFEEVKRLAAAYEAPEEAIELVREADILLVVGVTASGKNTIIGCLLETDDYSYIISHTTREPRYNHGVLEEDGRDYFFVDEATMGRLIKDQDFIEAKLVHDRDIYGTSTQQIRRAFDLGKIAVTDIDVQGVAEYKAMSEEVNAVFIVPPSFEEWHSRILRRSGEEGEDPANLRKRLYGAIDELEHALETGYFDFVINDDLNEAVERIQKLVHGARDEEHSKKGRVLAKQLLEQLKVALKTEEQTD